MVTMFTMSKARVGSTRVLFPIEMGRHTEFHGERAYTAVYAGSSRR